MKKEIKTELYASPEVEVIEIKALQVICESTELEQEGLDSYTDFGW